MAATTGRRPRAARPVGGAGARPRTDRGPVLLGLALVACALYAAFANGAIGLPQESWLQVGAAGTAFAALAVALLSRSGRFAPAPAALAGLGLMVAFAAWAGLSITWSIAPDESWLEANRTIAYMLVAASGIVLGSSLPRAAERVAVSFLAIAVVVALYALGGKLFPWLEVPGVIDLNHAARFSRLRAPLEYWNALAMICVLAIPIAVRAATDLGARSGARLAALVALVPLLTTLALTLSRGGLLVLVVALATLVAAGPERLRLLAAIGVGLLGALPAVLVGILFSDLTTDGLGESARTDDGLVLLLVLLAGIGVVFVLGGRLARAQDRVALSPRARARARRAGRIAAVAVPVVVLLALAVSDRGVTGTITHQIDEFTEPKFDPQNDPARVLRTNSGNRWIWWQEAAGAFSDRPLVGHGAGSFPLVHLAYRQEAIEVRQAHSAPLEFLAETGLIGTLLILGGIALLAFAAVANTRARAPGRERGFAIAMLAGCLAWSLHLWIDWDWHIAAVTLPVMAFLGVLAARPPGTDRPTGPAPTDLGRTVALAGGGALLLVVAALAFLPALSRELSSEALTQAASGDRNDLKDAAEKTALAKRLNPFAVEPLFAQASILERGNQNRAVSGVLVEALERQPNNPAVWSRLIRFQLLIDDAAGGVRSLLTLLALDPARSGLGGFNKFFFQDENSSASATGTPLPVKVARPKAPAPPPIAPAPSTPLTPAPPTPAPPPAPVAPRPPATPPRQPPSRPPSGDPFRLEG